jgi:thiamine pyrophosphate-dependent acetolactate synthase large subunit-like protein
MERNQITGAELVAKSLQALGITTVFGLTGKLTFTTAL